MGRPKGFPKSGGRAPGTPNKRRSIEDVCAAQGLDPFKEMARMAADLDEPNRFQALKELAQYLEPKKKAMEISGAIDMRVQQELESLMGMTEGQLIELIKKELG
jgi:hypothetical protein